MGNEMTVSPWGLIDGSGGLSCSQFEVQRAGLRRGFPDEGESDVPDCWAPFEGQIAIGWPNDHTAGILPCAAFFLMEDGSPVARPFRWDTRTSSVPN